MAVAVAGVMMMSLAGCNIIKRTKESIGKTVLAKVGDSEITRADVDQLLYYQLNNYKTQYGEDFEENDELKDTLKETRTQALESLIQEKLMLSKAEELGVTFDDSEITTKAEEQIKQYKDYTGSDEEYKKFIEQYGYTEDTFLDYWKEQSKLQMVYEKMIEGVEATDDEIKSYYDEHISEFKVNPGADVKDLVFTDEKTAEADAKVLILFDMRMKLRKINNNAILGACVIIMMLLCALSISQPLIFEKQMANREAEVKEKLMLIRSAEERYRAKHGVYTGDFAVLVKAKYLKAEDTLIPYSDGRKFSLAATTIIHKSGKQIPLMECGATYEDYLDGLNEEAIQQVTEKASDAGNFPGLKIGDITKDNDNASNW